MSKKLFLIFFCILLTISLAVFFSSCSKDDDNPVAPTTTTPPPGATWQQVFGADFTGVDGPLIGNWLLGVQGPGKDATNFNEMARGHGGEGGQSGLTDNTLNVSNVNKIKIVAKVSNLDNTLLTNSSAIMARISEDGSMYYINFRSGNISIMTMGAGGPVLIPGGDIGFAPLTSTAWYKIEVILTLGSPHSITATLYNMSATVIGTVTTTLNTGPDGPMCGFGLESTIPTYVYLDDFYVYKYELIKK